jgi:hypothetical protein
MYMTKISTESSKVARNRFVVVPALLERTDGKGMSQIVHSRPYVAGATD